MSLMVAKIKVIVPNEPWCVRPFVNVGRGSTRRYCSAACGTRERVAAYREARDSTSEAAAP
jgi:predicted RNA-binding Zn ribbon-like protein